MLSIQCRDVEQVVHYGGQAIELAQQTGSRGYIGRKLQGLQDQLAPLHDPRLSALSDQISRLAE